MHFDSNERLKCQKSTVLVCFPSSRSIHLRLMSFGERYNQSLNVLLRTCLHVSMIEYTADCDCAVNSAVVIRCHSVTRMRSQLFFPLSSTLLSSSNAIVSTIAPFQDVCVCRVAPSSFVAWKLSPSRKKQWSLEMKEANEKRQAEKKTDDEHLRSEREEPRF